MRAQGIDPLRLEAGTAGNRGSFNLSLRTSHGDSGKYCGCGHWGG
ncbi:TPA: late orf 1 [Pomona leaf-nosed bat associated polyomavirus]|nr:late orf 1 [Pomona leaf-nosed bat associated polyomavirus]SCC98881.1 TPA: late orf 1 [Pomona leaf-nosed bat associated polyomavirus]